MPREFLLPELAESVVEGEIVKWLVEEGELVAEDQALVEVMTDKVTVELPSPYAGVLEKRLVAEGDIVPVNQPIARFADDGTAEPGVEAAGEQASAEPDPSTADKRGEAQTLFKASPAVDEGSVVQVRKARHRGGRRTDHRRLRPGTGGSGRPEAGARTRYRYRNGGGVGSKRPGPCRRRARPRRAGVAGADARTGSLPEPRGLRCARGAHPAARSPTRHLQSDDGFAPAVGADPARRRGGRYRSGRHAGQAQARGRARRRSAQLPVVRDEGGGGGAEGLPDDQRQPRRRGRRDRAQALLQPRHGRGHRGRSGGAGDSRCRSQEHSRARR